MNLLTRLLAFCGLALVAIQASAQERRSEYVVVFRDSAAAQSFFNVPLAFVGQREGTTLEPQDVPPGDEEAPYLELNQAAPTLGSATIRVIGNDVAVELLRRHPQVEAVIKNEVAFPLLDTTIPLVKAPAVWAKGYTGSEFSIAVLDTGFDSKHPFLAGKVIHEACFSFNDAPLRKFSACPNGEARQYGSGAAAAVSARIAGSYHGTHVAGIAAGVSGAANPAAIDGVAKGASIVAIQVFHVLADPTKCVLTFARRCMASEIQEQVDALKYVLDIADQYNIVAVNMSFGATPARPRCDDQKGYKAIIDALIQRGIAVVIASGNNGKAAGVTLPACVSSATTVAAADDDDVLASFSNISPEVDLAAPGVGVISSAPGGGFISDRGTSMAAPHVAAAVALLSGAYPDAGVQKITDALKAGGSPLRTPGGGVLPRLDIQTAFEKLGR